MDPAISFRPRSGDRQRLRALASTQGCTVADIVRAAVTRMFEEPDHAQPDHTDAPLIELEGVPTLAEVPADDLDVFVESLVAGGHSL